MPADTFPSGRRVIVTGAAGGIGRAVVGALARNGCTVAACDVPAVEMNTASSNYAAEHNLAFSTTDCKDGQLVPISDSQGIWQLPAKDFPNH